MGEELLITVKEAGRRLGLGRSATYALIQKRALPSLRVGGSRRVAVADLIDFVERLRSQATMEEAQL